MALPSLPSSVLLALLFIALPVMTARSHRDHRALEIPRPPLYLSAALTQWVGVVLLLLVLWLDGDSLAGLGVRGGEGVDLTALWTMATIAASFTLGGLFYLVRQRLGQTESALVRHLIPRTNRERLIFALVVCPTAGFVEEVLFRGFAITRLAPLFGGSSGPWLAAAASSVVFALTHSYQGWLGQVRAGTVGFLLAVPYLLTGSLLPSIIAHAVIDVLSALVFYRFLEGLGPAPVETA